MAEQAFCSVFSHEDTAIMAVKWDARTPDRLGGSQVGLWRQMVHKIKNDPNAGKELLDLQGDYPGIGRDIIETDGLAVVDTYQVHDLTVRNQFGLHPVGPSTPQSIGAGVFTRSSYLNNCCIYNTKRYVLGDLLVRLCDVEGQDMEQVRTKRSSLTSQAKP